MRRAPRLPTTSLSQDGPDTVWDIQPQFYLPNTGKPVFPETGQERLLWGLMSHSTDRILRGFVLRIAEKAI